MVHFSYIPIFIIFNVHSVLSQSSICVWGAKYWNPHINGLYTKQGTHDTKSYYLKTGGRTCDQLYIYWSISHQDYSISDVLGSSNVYAFCQTSTILITCDAWRMTRNLTTDEIVPNVHVMADECPSWNCDQISVPFLPNGCDVTFDVYLEDNIWTDSLNTRYFNFDPLWFEWQCDESYPDYCAESWLAYSASGWSDLQNGESASLYFLYPDRASYTVYCMSPTQAPTLLPTTAPTSNPLFMTSSTPSSSPTSIPTSFPTLIPTLDPTQTPHVITLNPTIAPSHSPIIRFTTRQPFSQPTLRVIESKSTESPTKRPTDDFDEREVQESTVVSSTPAVQHPPSKKNKKTIFRVMIVICVVVICICALCILIMIAYYRKVANADADEDQKRMSFVIDSDNVGAVEIPKVLKLSMQRERVCSLSDNVQNTSVVEIPKVLNLSMQRERVCSLSSQYEEHDDDDKEAEREPEEVDTKNDDSDFVVTVEDTTGGVTVRRDDKELSQLKMWLCATVRLPQYYDVFVANGYDRLDIIKEITKKEELQEIGIMLKGHNKKLLKEIARL